MLTIRAWTLALAAAGFLGCQEAGTQPAPVNEPAAGAAPAGNAPALHARFGFAGLEIYKADAATARLRCADVNGDGLTDLAVVNNARATIDLFLQKTPAEIAASAARSLEYDNINEIASDARFRKEPFLTEKRVSDLLVEDLTGDGRPDLAYYGDPKELVIVPRTASGWSDARQRFAVGEARAFGRGLAAGDLTGDGRADLVLLGAEKVYLFAQGADGRLAEPVEIPISDKNFFSVAVADLDGDGRRDLALIGSGQTEPVRVRFQGAGGLGPETAVETAALRSHLVADLDGDGRAELACVQEATGRLAVFRLDAAPPDAAVPLGRIRIYPFRAAGESARHALALGDVDGDGRTDVLAASPAAAQVDLFRQAVGGGLLPPESFPGLAGPAALAAGDLDGDGRVEVVVLSAEEKAIGVTRWEGARLAFPRSVPLKGRPVCAATADLDGKPGLELAAAVEEEGGAKAVYLFAAGEPLRPLGAPLKLDKAKDSPERLAFFDADQDGRADLFAFFPYEAPRILLREAADDGDAPRWRDVTEQKDFGRGLLQGSVAASFAAADPDGDGKPEFLLAKKNFARAFRVSAAGALEVVEQFNAPESSSEIAGAASADVAGDARAEVILLDKARNALWVLARGERGTWEPAGEIKIPAFRHRGVAAADLTGDGRADLLVAGDDRFGVLPAGGSDFRLRRAAQYETELKGARLDAVAAGDLDGDGKAELVVSDIGERLLEILVPDAGPDGLARANRFKVFEDKSRGEIPGDARAAREPRELAVADVTGDRKPDLVLLIHDRILVYPQE